MTRASLSLDPARARALWLHAQRLDVPEPFGHGPEAVHRATAHLGYVQIDTIHVIQRSHHHILYTRIPRYAPRDLECAQAQDRSVFEYWTHALSYVPIEDYRFFARMMAVYRTDPPAAYARVVRDDYAALLRRIRRDGALSIRDIDDDVLVEKEHAWDSRKPSKRALRLGFYNGDLTISQRVGMLRRYELSARHFGWRRRPAPASDRQFAQYLLQRALRAQAIVSVDSICYGDAGSKPLVRALLASAVRRRELVPMHLAHRPDVPHWVAPALLENPCDAPRDDRAHLLSPFDPVVIQRKRLELFFGYEHRFEAYVPPDKRMLGYFALPVLVGDRIVAALDLKMDRQADRLRVQQWTWIGKPRPVACKPVIEEALHRFEAFQRA